MLPHQYKHQLCLLYEDIKQDISKLLREYFGGHYIREERDDYIRLKNILGTPLIFDLKVEGSGNLLYKSAVWGSTGLICHQKEYNELQDENLLDVYESLWKITKERS